MATCKKIFTGLSFIRNWFLFSTVFSFRPITEDWDKELLMSVIPKVLLDVLEDWDREIALLGETKVLLDWKFNRKNLICIKTQQKKKNCIYTFVKIVVKNTYNIFIFIFNFLSSKLIVWFFVYRFGQKHIGQIGQYGAQNFLF